MGAVRAGPARPQGPAVRAGDAPAADRGRGAGGHVRRAPRGRRDGAPPLRVVRHQRAALRRAGRRGPGRARHQADALPHLRRLPRLRRPDRRRPGRQAGRGRRRDQGPLRRAVEHHLGPRAGARRLPRRLRPGRAQDPLQARAGGAPGEGPAAPLRPRRHRQLQPQDRAGVRGPGPVHRRPGDRGRPHRPVQHPHRLLPPDQLPVADGGAAGAARRDRRAGSSGPPSTPAPASPPGCRSR